ncbi:ras-GEF domain-containing family member 1B [Culicoides brevitarsis]|uniref:ras-GEF domain-containing family member 1B n=1 Tax=Culicoides brevitarsis TaxID=469753 RepID=UPI00307B2010
MVVKSSDSTELCESVPVDFMNASMGIGGIMYHKGEIISGPLESLIDLLVPKRDDDYDKEFVFSFLLSSRLYMRPHEIFGGLLNLCPEHDSLENIVRLLKTWTKTFPYDFRDERMMAHVKHIATRCAETDLNETVSQLLCALLKRLTDLERHEQYLRSCQNIDGDPTEGNAIEWPSVHVVAQILCRIERGLARHVGPEEFVQCSGIVLREGNDKKDFDSPLYPKDPPGCQDPKKTCNLESYVEWSSRLKLLVANEILKCPKLKDRHKKLELWSGVAQYCLLVGNYNSATSILESLETTPISRLKETWSSLSSTTSQQLDCMQRHAEGCGSLWKKQSQDLDHALNRQKVDIKALSQASTLVRSKSSEWVVIPVFVDIVRLALKARTSCLQRLPNGDINMTACNRLAAVVGAFTRHIRDIHTSLTEPGNEHDALCQYMQSCKLMSESDLMLASFDCEEPTQAEKQLYDII